MSANGAVVPLKVEINSFCWSRSLHIHSNSTSSIGEVCLHNLSCSGFIWIIRSYYVQVCCCDANRCHPLNTWRSGLVFKKYFASVFAQSVQVAGTGGPALRSASAATTALATPSMAPANAFLAGLERIALRVCFSTFILSLTSFVFCIAFVGNFRC